MRDILYCILYEKLKEEYEEVDSINLKANENLRDLREANLIPQKEDLPQEHISKTPQLSQSIENFSISKEEKSNAHQVIHSDNNLKKKNPSTYSHHLLLAENVINDKLKPHLQCIKNIVINMGYYIEIFYAGQELQGSSEEDQGDWQADQKKAVVEYFSKKMVNLKDALNIEATIKEAELKLLIRKLEKLIRNKTAELLQKPDTSLQYILTNIQEILFLYIDKIEKQENEQFLYYSNTKNLSIKPTEGEIKRLEFSYKKNEFDWFFEKLQGFVEKACNHIKEAQPIQANEEDIEEEKVGDSNEKISPRAIPVTQDFERFIRKENTQNTLWEKFHNTDQPPFEDYIEKNSKWKKNSLKTLENKFNIEKEMLEKTNEMIRLAHKLALSSDEQSFIGQKQSELKKTYEEAKNEILKENDKYEKENPNWFKKKWYKLTSLGGHICGCGDYAISGDNSRPSTIRQIPSIEQLPSTIHYNQSLITKVPEQNNEE